MKQGLQREVVSLEIIRNKNVSRITVEVYYIMTYFIGKEEWVNPEGNWGIQHFH